MSTLKTRKLQNPDAPQANLTLDDAGSVTLVGIGTFAHNVAPQEGDVLVYRNGRWEPGSGIAVLG
jgi:hypothetical protein